VKEKEVLTKEQREDNEAMFKAVEKAGGIEKWLPLPTEEKAKRIAEFLPPKPAPPTADAAPTAAKAPAKPAAPKKKATAKPGAKPGARVRAKPAAVAAPPPAPVPVVQNYTTHNTYNLGDAAFIATVQEMMLKKQQQLPQGPPAHS
jgi:hypothetical protein